MRSRHIVVLALGLMLSPIAQAEGELPAIPTDCKRFVKEQVQKGAELMRLLSLESVRPGMADAEWTACRRLVLIHINAGMQRAKEESAAKARAYREELKRKADEGQRIRDQCRADGGHWSRVKNRCITRAETEARWGEAQEAQKQAREAYRARREAKRRRNAEAIQRMNAEAERQKREREARGTGGG